MPFRKEIKKRVLLWCARHCCLCNRAVGVGIEIAHLDPSRNDIDNAIPLCFDCHAQVGHYRDEHPRGKKFRDDELRLRRDQVYEEHTAHLRPQVHYRLIQGEQLQFPDVGFTISHLGGPYPVQVRVDVRLYHSTLKKSGYAFGTPGHYNGELRWNLNPGFGVSGHFAAPVQRPSADDPLRALINVIVIDIYEREHRLLPVGYVLTGAEMSWYLEPSVKVVEEWGSVHAEPNRARSPRRRR